MTPVEQLLEKLYESKQRVILHFGDTKTGRDYDEVYGIEGRVSKSTGSKPIYILVHNRRALGGGAILVDSIVKIETAAGRVELYRHSNYHRLPYCEYCGVQECNHSDPSYPSARACTRSGEKKYDKNTGWALGKKHRHPM